MGCWNKTCGLTNIHIGAGEDVVVVALAEQTPRDSLCYPTSMWSPILMPFYAKYDDYGGGEDCSGFGLDVVMGVIQSNLIELDVGENKCHDIAVKRGGFDVDQFFKACHEERLQMRSIFGRTSKINFVMFHKSAWDHILENYELERYVRDPNAQWGGRTIVYKYADIVADIPALVTQLMALSSDDVEFGFGLARWMREMHREDENLAVRWVISLDGQSHRYGPFRINEHLARFVEAGDAQGLTELITEFIKAMVIDSFFSDTRKTWIPQTGEGSQQQDIKPYYVLIQAMNNILDKQRQEDSEYGDD